MPADTTVDQLFWYRLLTWVWVPVQLMMIFGLIAIASNTQQLATWEAIFMAAVVGVGTGGIGITYAHELIHQKSRFERRLGEVLMCSTLYAHWCVEHLYGHHVHVATPDDPATAREGENIYRFLTRVLYQTLISSWYLQKKTLERRNLSMWSLKSAFWRYSVITGIFIVASVIIGGWLGLAILVIQSAIAILLLELVDYIEHYGLLRKQLENGRYESTKPHHSWNSGHQVSNWLLINLQRHSDHHYKPTRRFPTLQNYPESEAPQLPMGYPWMVLVALVPPLWFRIMDPKLAEWKQQFYSM